MGSNAVASALPATATLAYTGAAVTGNMWIAVASIAAGGALIALSRIRRIQDRKILQD